MGVYAPWVCRVQSGIAPFGERAVIGGGKVGG